MRECTTWMWLVRTCWTTVDWRLWRTVCRSSTERSLQMTPLWCPCSSTTGLHTHVAPTWMGLLCRWRGGGRRPPYLSWVASSARRGWSCWGARWLARGLMNASVVCANWPKPSESAPEGRGQTCVLPCNAARAVALSLLERRGGTPSTLQVLADARDVAAQ